MFPGKRRKERRSKEEKGKRGFFLQGSCSFLLEITGYKSKLSVKRKVNKGKSQAKRKRADVKMIGRESDAN